MIDDIVETSLTILLLIILIITGLFIELLPLWILIIIMYMKNMSISFIELLIVSIITCIWIIILEIITRN